MDQFCELCGSREFSVIDGLYFCTVCQSQSQHFREVAAEDVYLAAPLRFAELIRYRPQNSDQVIGEKDKKSAPQPLSLNALYEVYTLALKRFTAILIDFGFPKILEKSVMLIWAKYLSAKGVAFSTCFSVTPLKEDTSHIRSSSPDLFEDTSMSANELQRKAPLELRKMLVFSVLYIAILECRIKLLMSDLLRLWIDGYLSLQDFCETLPPEYQHPIVSCHFEHAMSGLLSSYHTLTCLMYNTLGIGSIVSMDVKDTFSKMLYHLNLPDELIHRIMLLHGMLKPCHARQFNYITSNADVPCSEFKCLALITVCLKLIFGLDDRREYILSKLAATQKNDSFVFTHWLTQFKLRLGVLNGEKVDNVLRADWIDPEFSGVRELSDAVFGVRSYLKRVRNKKMKARIISIFDPSDDVASKRPRMSFFPLREVVDCYEENSIESNSNCQINQYRLNLFLGEFHTHHLDFLNRLPEHVSKDLASTRQSDDFLPGFEDCAIENTARSHLDALFPCRQFYNRCPLFDATNSTGRYAIFHHKSRTFSATFNDLLDLLSDLYNDLPDSLASAVYSVEYLLFGHELRANPAE